MGTSATRAKRKYNSKTYERLEITVKAGEKEKIKQRAGKIGKSINAYITDLIYADMKKEG
jgi:hypothetical protein